MLAASCVPERSASRRPRWPGGTAGGSCARADAAAHRTSAARYAPRIDAIERLRMISVRVMLFVRSHGHAHLDPPRRIEARRIRERGVVRRGVARVVGAPGVREDETVSKARVGEVEHAAEDARGFAREAHLLLRAEIDDERRGLPSGVRLE